MADVYMPPAGADSGSQGSKDPTLVSGQDPDSLFGMAMSYDSGAGGSAGAGGTPQDPTNMPNQYPGTEPISGVTLDGSGAPGSQGIDATANDSGGIQVQVTDPNYVAGKPGGGSGVQQVTVSA